MPVPRIVQPLSLRLQPLLQLVVGGRRGFVGEAGDLGRLLEAERVDEAEDFLLRIRSILHLERQRNLNVLTHELQETVARAFGYPGEKLARQVETLMSTYFHHARIINRALKASLKFQIE